LIKNTNPGSRSGIVIKKLSIYEHKKILTDLKFFWISQSTLMKPLHHPLFGLLFTDFSFVLYRDSQVIAYVYAAHNKNKGFIHILATRVGEYRKGYATMLLRRLENSAREKNLKNLWAYCLFDNVSSRRFFEKNQYIMQKEIDISTDEKRILFKKAI
jgi:RimJ/RimL family protein N-acetyltransferase